MARGWLLSVGLVAAIACSGRTKREEPGAGQGAAGERATGGDSASGGRAATSGGSVATSGGSAGATGGSSSSEGCAIAYRHDRCCPRPEPVRREELESDPCLQEWSPLGPVPSTPAACEFPACDAVCAPLAPESRSVALGADGACRFKDECESAEDCAVFLDAKACCSCPVAFPKAWSGELECLVEEGDPFPGDCRKQCGPVACGPCEPHGALVCLSDGDAFARCGFEPFEDLGPEQCAAEQACTGECDLCLAEGEQACGGPAPPPAECESDADCRARAENLNCEEVPCQNKRCVQGCLLDDDCGESEVCDDYHCRPAPCSSDAACSTNHVCLVDLCVRRPCESSAECGGYCVNGLCRESPGKCEFGCLP